MTRCKWGWIARGVRAMVLVVCIFVALASRARGQNIWVSNITTTSAIVNISSNSISLDTVSVEYGPTTAYGTKTYPQVISPPFGSIVLLNLQPDTLYHFRVWTY